MQFKIFFNKKRQWINVYTHDVHPNTFARWKAGRWGYFEATYEKHRTGEFGELHLVEQNLRYDTIAHEAFHIWAEWIWSNGETLTRKNEERSAEFVDEMVRKIIRALKAELRVRL